MLPGAEEAQPDAPGRAAARLQRQTLHRPCATSAFTRVMPQICAIQPLPGGIPAA